MTPGPHRLTYACLGCRTHRKGPGHCPRGQKEMREMISISKVPLKKDVKAWEALKKQIDKYGRIVGYDY